MSEYPWIAPACKRGECTHAVCPRRRSYRCEAGLCGCASKNLACGTSGVDRDPTPVIPQPAVSLGTLGIPRELREALTQLEAVAQLVRPEGVTPEEMRGHVLDAWRQVTTPDAAQVDRCQKCRRPFDPTDTKWGGSAQQGEGNPYCRGCYDRCHDGGAEHVCVICDPDRYRVRRRPLHNREAAPGTHIPGAADGT